MDKDIESQLEDILERNEDLLERNNEINEFLALIDGLKTGEYESAIIILTKEDKVYSRTVNIDNAIIFTGLVESAKNINILYNLGSNE